MNRNRSKRKTFLGSFIQTVKSFVQMLPVLVGVILLLGLISVLVPKVWITRVFVGNPVQDTLVGSTVGSLFAGNALTSYVIGGELLKRGVSLFAVTAFIVAWVTVGLVQLPVEAFFLGKKFVVIRNITSFVLSVFLAILVTFILTMVGV